MDRKTRFLRNGKWLPLCAVWALIATMALTGCKSPTVPKPGKYVLRLTRDPLLEKTNLRVDVLGLKEDEWRRLDKMGRAEYFGMMEAERSWRAELLRGGRVGREFYFAAGATSANPQLLERHDPLWRHWASNRVSYVVVVDDHAPQDQPLHITSIRFDGRNWKQAPRYPGKGWSSTRVLDYGIQERQITLPSVAP